MSIKIRHLIFNIFLLIIVQSHSLLAQEASDTIVFVDKEKLLINIRKIEFKNDLIKTPRVENGNIFLFNYLPEDIDHITTNDTVYVNMVSRKHPDLLHLFYYEKDKKIYSYIDLYDSRSIQKTEIQKRKKVKKDSTSHPSIFGRIRARLKDTTGLNNVIDFKWGLKAGITSIYHNQTKTTVTPTYNSFTTSSLKNAEFSFNNYFISLIRADKQKNIHEFEVGLIKYNSVDQLTINNNNSTNKPIITGGSKVNTFNFGLAYHYQYTFLKRKKTRFIPFIEFTANPTYQYAKTIPKVSTSYHSATNTIGLNLFIAPGLYYFFSKNVFLSASLPINFFYHNHYILYVENPNVPINRRTVSYDYSELFPALNNLYFRISIGFKL